LQQEKRLEHLAGCSAAPPALFKVIQRLTRIQQNTTEGFKWGVSAFFLKAPKRLGQNLRRIGACLDRVGLVRCWIKHDAESCGEGFRMVERQNRH